MKLHFRYHNAEAMKIKQCKNLTDEYYYERKFPGLRYTLNYDIAHLTQQSSDPDMTTSSLKSKHSTEL